VKARVWLDHVVYAVPDLERAGARWERELGLASVEGGRHVRWGTANRIVPFGTQYLEMIGVVDRDEAVGTAFGRSVLELGGAGGGWMMPVLATDDIEAVGTRLGLDVDVGSRRRADGVEIRWRSAGFDDPRRAAWVPFFIQWDIGPELYPGGAPVEHPSGATGIASVEIAGDAEALAGWTGEPALPFVVSADEPAGVRAVSLATPDGELVVR
jgi:catechol 2,3-dioxygenase-like lactoylglutathione lyase family enzyme